MISTIVSFICDHFVQFLAGALLLICIIKNRRKVVQKDYTRCLDENCFRCSQKRLVNKLHKQYSDYCNASKTKDAILCDVMEKYLSQLSKHETNANPLTIVENSNPKFEQKTIQGTSLQDDVETLENNCDIFLDEYLSIARDLTAHNGWIVNDTPGGRWCIFYLVNQGTAIENNISACPKTYNIINNLHNFMRENIFGNVCFSVIFPNTNIPEHCGPVNRARCHLGLVTPEECSIEVNGIKYSWKKSKCLIFDDAYRHSVTYKTDDTSKQPRAVLMVDFWHPGLPQDRKNALQTILRS